MDSEEGLSAHTTDVLSSSLFLEKFQTKAEARNSSGKYVNESRRACRAADCIWNELRANAQENRAKCKNCGHGQKSN